MKIWKLFSFAAIQYLNHTLIPNGEPTMESTSPETIVVGVMRDGNVSVITHQTLELAAVNRDAVLELLRRLIGNSDRPRVSIREAMMVTCTPVAEDSCSICLEEADCARPGPRWVSLARCSHRFHADCIRRWQEDTCPNCRTVQR